MSPFSSNSAYAKTSIVHWCDKAITMVRRRDYDGAIEHRFIAIVPSSSCHRIISIVLSCHRVIAPNTMVRWCDSELRCSIRIPYTCMFMAYALIIPLIRFWQHSIYIQKPYQSWGAWRQQYPPSKQQMVISQNCANANSTVTITNQRP